MDANRPEGRVEALKGGIKEGVGAALGDVKTEWEGKMERAQGNLQDMYGQTKDSIADATYAAGRQVMTYEDSLRQGIREQPYLAMAVAFGIGICLGHLTARYRSDDQVRTVYRY
jgi:uncharacterized protein YjbJ (UPF0337 family)